MKTWRRVLITALFSTLTLTTADADHRVVLVTRADSPLDSIDTLDIRKIYLGFAVRTDSGVPVRGATNASDDKLFDIFLQDVMAMSASAYDRRLLTLTLQSGRRRPEVFTNVSELTKALNVDATLVTYMWEEDFRAADNLKVLRVLWKD